MLIDSGVFQHKFAFISNYTGS